MNAVEAGEISKVLDFIYAGADINLKQNGWTPLGRASRTGKLDIVQALIRHGVDLETRMDIGWGILPGDGTALNWAAAEGHLEIVKLLVSKNAKIDPNAEKPIFFGTGGTPLIMAAGKGRLDVVRFLLDSGADQGSPEGKPGWNAFLCACREGQIEIMKYFCQTKGFDVRRKGADGLTPLHVAAKHNEPNSMKFLVESGALLDAKDGKGNTPLHLVASDGRKRAAIWLRLRGADLKPKNDDGMTPLDVAKSRFSGSDTTPDLVKCLDWNLPDPEPETGCIVM
jgi:ankyrin repeat protein